MTSISVGKELVGVSSWDLSEEEEEEREWKVGMKVVWVGG
jgi:hypothetical protein